MNIYQKIINMLRKSGQINPANYFLTKHYQIHNIARLKHLDSLGLDLYGKKVIEFGAGVGDHTYFYLIKNCDVTSTDARPELVSFIEKRFGNKTMIINVETDLNMVLELPKFDIIHCYGLLYHINNPEEFLRSLKGKGSLLLLETCVSSDYKTDMNYIVEEDSNDPTQAFSGKGSRPTRSWIFNLLKELFPFVYVPISQPDHIEFPKDWNIDFSDSSFDLKRAIFIASEIKLNQSFLTNILPKIYK